MTHINTNMSEIYLWPGTLLIVNEPALITTVLGSCVSVTMFNSRLRIGGICHGLLPQCKDDGFCEQDRDICSKYVDCSIRLMIREFGILGIRKNEIEVKLFGGADMYPLTTDRSYNKTVGRQNIESSFRLLREEGLPVLNSDTGGSVSRKIIFHSHTGEVFLKKVSVKNGQK
jgi:chemotaxis protein CheD